MKKYLRNLFYWFNFDKLIVKLSYTQKLVGMDNIRCQRRFLYSNYRGFGGKRIEFFPPYKIFKIYPSNPQKAKDLFVEFFYDNILNSNALEIPKVEGGWFKGTTYKAVSPIFKKNDIKINKKTLKDNKELILPALLQRVDHYFDIFDSVREEGFVYSKQPITAEKKKGLYYLMNGHHRVAILSVLNYNKIIIKKITKLKTLMDRISRILG